MSWMREWEEEQDRRLHERYLERLTEIEQEIGIGNDFDGNLARCVIFAYECGEPCAVELLKRLGSTELEILRGGSSALEAVEKEEAHKF